MTIDSGVIAGNATHHYVFRLWIEENIYDDTLTKNKTLTFRIGCKIAQDDRELAKVDNYPEPMMELLTTSTSISSSNNLAEFKMNLSNVSDEVLQFKPIAANKSFEIVNNDGTPIDVISLDPSTTIGYTCYLKNIHPDFLGTTTMAIYLEMESPYHETILTDQFITIYIGMESWLKANGAVTLTDALYMSDNMNPNVESAKEEIIKKGIPDFNMIAPLVTYAPKVDNIKVSFTTGGVLSMASSYRFDSETGVFSLVNPIQDYVNGGNYTNYYTCNRTDPGTCTTLYQIKNYDTITQEGSISYKIAEISYVSYVKTSLLDSSGLYKSEDDYGDTFYYRGEIYNNYVQFGSFIRVGTTYYSSIDACVAGGNTKEVCKDNTKNMYWRVVRVNGDGSVRLIYFGEDTEVAQAGVLLPNSNSRTSVYNSIPYDPTYVGYTYGKDFVDKTSSKVTFLNVSKNYQYYFYKNPPIYNESTETFVFDSSDTNNYKIGYWHENYAEIIANYPYTCWSTGKYCLKGNPYFEVSEYPNNPNQAVGHYHSFSSNHYDSTISNAYDSIIKNNLDSWFEAVFMNQERYKNDISGNSLERYLADNLFCNDRSYSGGNGADLVPTTIYGPYERNYDKKTPSLKCQNKSDRYTVNDIEVGNGWLKYPVSLITIDEVAFAGGKYGNVNSKFYLNTGFGYFSLSPYFFNQFNVADHVWNVTESGVIGPSWNSANYGVRAVINLSADVLFVSGNGTSRNPYVISVS